MSFQQQNKFFFNFQVLFILEQPLHYIQEKEILLWKYN